VAPLNEVLAAGILLLSGWNAATSLIDPMCGSGTIPIEAGMIACNMAPGRFRKFFGFQKWRDYDEELFGKLKSDCENEIRSSPVRIYASDISEHAISQTGNNLVRAGLQEMVSLELSDFKDVKSADNQGHVFLNPPYGQRLQPEELDSLYGMIGTTLKHNFQGNTAWLITSNRESLKKVGLRSAEKHTLFNGALECTLLKYEMYQGTRKQVKI
jgi:putative N6-adenine-specific DNA methylase